MEQRLEDISHFGGHQLRLAHIRALHAGIYSLRIKLNGGPIKTLCTIYPSLLHICTAFYIH
jgi:hypothetical protein